MALRAVGGNFFIEPRLNTDRMAANLKKRSGLLVAAPDNKHSFEGVPNTGVIRFVPEGYAGELKVGMMVVFDEPKPKGFKNPDNLKMTLFPLQREQIIARIPGEDERG